MTGTALVLGRPNTVVFDLFGTLVDAPTGHQRTEAGREIASILGVAAEVVEMVLINSWAHRHDGRLRSLTALTDFLRQRCGEGTQATEELRMVLRRQAASRLAAPSDVLAVLTRLRGSGMRIGVLSDASAEIAEGWADCELSRSVDAAVFSCAAGAVKPNPDLYRLVLDRLAATRDGTLYCGDGGGDELNGATAAGLTAIRVNRRGGPTSLAFGDRPWPGPSIRSITELPALLATGQFSR